jgi:hypothetical protein
VWCIGRVVGDVASEEGPNARLTPVVLCLEGMRGASDGARVHLDTRKLTEPGAPGARFFPGQVGS